MSKVVSYIISKENCVRPLGLARSKNVAQFHQLLLSRLFFVLCYTMDPHYADYTYDKER